MWRADIRLDDNWHLTQAADGDAPIVSGLDSVLQEIKLEALTQEGELFYDTTWGWSLLDFLQSQDDELTRLEVQERIKSKLGQRPEVNVETILTEVTLSADAITICTTFSFLGDSQTRSVNIDLNRISVEVQVND